MASPKKVYGAPKKSEERFENESKLLEDSETQQSDSEKFYKTRRDDWDDLESIWYAKNEDSGTKNTKNRVFNPVLGNIIIERSGRIMAQYPGFKVDPTSTDDIGKGQLVNLLLKHYMKCANEQFSFMTKMQYATQFDKVYGSQFLLVPWRIKPDYAGPEAVLLDMWDCYPQPGVTLNDADWFIHRSIVNIHWLVNQAKQSPDVWNKEAIMSLAKRMKTHKDEGDTINNQDHQSYIDRRYYPTKVGDAAYPSVELYTAYRRNQWITWTPQRTSDKTSKPYVLRVVKNPYPENMLPIVAKNCFPMLKSAIGFGEIERGKSLQYGLNSLINLKLTGTKFSIFPPIHVNPDEANIQSMKWKSGVKWMMDRPGQSAVAMPIRPQTEDFQSVYGLFMSAMQEMGGTTNVTKGQQSDSNIGKTPQAINYMAMQQAARDSIDQRMLEETLGEIGKRWVALLTDPEQGKLTEEIAVRIHGDELQEIAEHSPDVLELFNDRAGNARISKEYVSGKYDLEVEPSSTLKPDDRKEAEVLTTIVKAAVEPGVKEEMMIDGKRFNMGELMKRWIVAQRVKDVDKIIVDAEQSMPGMEGQMPMDGQMPVDPAMAGQMPPEVQQMPVQQPQPRQIPQYEDPEINDTVQQVLSASQGAPPLV